MALSDAALSELPLSAFTSETLDVSVSETMSATDSVSALAIFESAVVETMSAGDVPSADGIVGGTISEAASATDVFDASGIFPASVTETTSASDAYSATGTLAAAVVESAPISDELEPTQYSMFWFLSFEDVVPPPEGEGPGNPGILKKGLRQRRVYPPLRRGERE